MKPQLEVIAEGRKSLGRKEPIMCYELESWHWKARAKEMHKAQTKAGAEKQNSEPVKPAPQTAGAQPQTRPVEKVPA